MSFIKNNLLFLAILALCINVCSAGTIRYQHTDILGSVIAETDESGNVISRSHYEPFGLRTAGEKAGIGYTGHLQDEELSLSYMQARYYDPVIGRFYSNDPVDTLGHMHRGNPTMGFNRYAYANNNPYKYTDPDGKFALLAWFATPPGIAALQYTGSALVGIMGGVAIAEAVDNTGNSDNSAPGLPDGLVGDQSDDRAGPSRGKRHNSGPLTPENGGTGNAEEDFGKLTGGTGKPAEGRKEGTRTGENGITIRPGKEGEGPRIDIPANGEKPPETLHYDK